MTCLIFPFLNPILCFVCKGVKQYFNMACLLASWKKLLCIISVFDLSTGLEYRQEIALLSSRNLFPWYFAYPLLSELFIAFLL